MTDKTKITPPSTGCYVDGHWGQYATAGVVIIAEDYGYDDAEAISLAEKHLKAMGPNDNPDLTDDEMESLVWFADKAEQWLNENVSNDGFSWDWHDGEFFYMSTEW